MALYTGKPVTIERPAQQIADMFADLTQLQPFIDKLPDAEREKLAGVELEPDSLAFDAPQLGKVKFRVEERTPQRIVMKAVGTPLPLALDVDLAQLTDASTKATCAIDVEIPAMLKAFVGPQLQKAADMLSLMIGRMAGASI